MFFSVALMKTVTFRFATAYLCLLIASSIAVYAQDKEIDLINITFDDATALYNRGQYAEAAIAFYNLQRSTRLPAWQRNNARKRFESAMVFVRNNTEQTDRFGELISLQRDDHVMQVLINRYVGILESQGRHEKMIEIQRYILRLWPTAQNKYSLALRLQKSGQYVEAHALYESLLQHPRYNIFALRQLIDIVEYLPGPDELIQSLIDRYGSQISGQYDLSRGLFMALVGLGKNKEAFRVALDMASKYDDAIEMLVYQIALRTDEAHITLDMIKTMLDRYDNDTPLMTSQRYFIARLFAAYGEFETAIDWLGDDSSPQVIEYKADLLYSADRLIPAQKLYLAMIGQADANPQWYQRLADIAFRASNDEDAIAYLYKYLDTVQGDAFNAHFYVARTFERYGYADEAEKVYLKAKESSPNRNLVAMELIKYYLNQNNYSLAAEEILEIQVTNHIDPSTLYFNIKSSLASRMDAQKLIQALDDLTQTKIQEGVLQGNTVNDVYFCLYVFSVEIGDIENAVAYFEHFFTEGVRNEHLAIEFAGNLKNDGNPDPALRVLALIPENSSQQRHVVDVKAQIYLEQGRYDEIIRLYEDQTHFVNPIIYARAFFYLGLLDRARNVIANQTVTQPEYTMLNGDIYTAEYDFQAAVRAYESIKRTDLLPVALAARARTYLFWNKFDIVVSLCEEITRRYPGSTEAAEALILRTNLALMAGAEYEGLRLQWADAEFLAWKRNYTAAIAAYSAIIEAAPDALLAPELYARLAAIYDKNNQKAEAIGIYERICIECPESAYAPVARRKAIALKKELGYDIDIQAAYIQFLQDYPNSYDADFIRTLLEAEQKRDTPVL